jgi:hypothetical protein
MVVDDDVLRVRHRPACGREVDAEQALLVAEEEPRIEPAGRQRAND